MKALRTQTPAALDNPSRWNQHLKPWFNAERYQRQLDQVVGLNKDRKPIIRLRWAQDVWQYAFNESTPRYWTKRQRRGSSYIYWTVPRWIFEKRLEPEQYVDSWNATRYSLTDAAGNTVDKGPAPEEYYTFAYLCAEHEAVDPSNGWAHCCTRAYDADRSRCWGTYRQPNDDDLELVRQAVRAMEADKYRSPYRPLTTAELQEAELAANMQVERSNAEFAEYEQQLMKDFIKLHGHRLFEGPDTFHDMGAAFSKRTDSGLYIAEDL